MARGRSSTLNPIFTVSSDWADRQGKRWAFTLSNAGANYFEDRCSLDQLHEINWDAVAAQQWSGRGISSTVKEGKQAEFLLEQCFPWKLVDRIGVLSQAVSDNVRQAIADANHRPKVEIQSRLVLLEVRGGHDRVPRQETSFGPTWKRSLTRSTASVSWAAASPFSSRMTSRRISGLTKPRARAKRCNRARCSCSRRAR